MANSRKSRSRNNGDDVQEAFERALGNILARVHVSAIGKNAAPTGGSTRMPERPVAVAVAYSGGLDSSVLLHLASRYAAAHDVAIHAFHIHHGLSANADAWAAHCRTESGNCGAVFADCKVAVSVNGRGTEEAARIARYAALGDLCRHYCVSLLLTAHHQDDQAETVLLQLMRGAGMPGISGMPAFQPHHDLLGSGIALGRPLLGIARAQLEQAAYRCGVKHIVDESNSDVRYRRNALRHTVFPVIETYFPGFSPLVTRSALHAQSAQLLLHDLAMMDCAVCKAGAQDAALDISKLKSLSTERADNLLRHWLHEHGVQLPSRSRLDEIRVQMFEAVPDTHPFFDFGAVKLRRIDNRLELHPDLGTPPCDALALRWQGESAIHVPQWHGRLVFERCEGEGLDAAMLRNGMLRLRPRMGRERIKIAKNRPSKSLKNLFQELSIAPWKREWLPLLYLDNDLLFVAGLGMDTRNLKKEGGVTIRWEMT